MIQLLLLALLQAVGGAEQARPVAGDPGISSMVVVDRPEFRVLRDYAEPGATRRMHSHDDATYHVFTLVTGQLRLTIEGEPPQDVVQGQVLTLKGGAKHTFTNSGTVTATIVEVFGKQPPPSPGPDLRPSSTGTEVQKPLEIDFSAGKPVVAADPVGKGRKRP